MMIVEISRLLNAYTYDNSSIIVGDVTAGKLKLQDLRALFSLRYAENCTRHIVYKEQSGQQFKDGKKTGPAF